jgi:3',5'-cyclic-AMP phosphodiesterase
MQKTCLNHILLTRFMVGLCLFNMMVSLFLGINTVAAESATEYERIVILGDPHLPVQPAIARTPQQQAAVIEAKEKVVDDINSWDDVSRVVVVGDLVGRWGTESEYATVKEFLAKIKPPVSPIMGNHEFMYTDADIARKLLWGSSELRQAKMQRFRTTFGLPEVYYSIKTEHYLLLFLSPDMTNAQYQTQISTKELGWLETQLQNNQGLPAIVFFHAPLAGTLPFYNKDANTPQFIAQPEEPLRAIIHRHLQLFLWVSGHTHTPPTNLGYASSLNLYENQVTNIHNTDMDRQTIWTNSLYLYPDKVVVRTYNHKQQVWVDELERTILVPKK